MASSRRGPLRFLAGERALTRLQRDGLSPDMVTGFAGAAGGPKWLALNHLDRAIFGRWLKPVTAQSRFLIGSSIATWRFACAAQKTPEAAFQRFEEAYMAQRYSGKPTRREISDQARAILDHVLGERGIDEILANQQQRLQVMTVLSRGLVASERALPLNTGLAAAGLTNLAGRRALRAFFRRALFHHPAGASQMLAAFDPGMEHIPLTGGNLRQALLASGSIPSVMEAETAIPDAPRGVYRDGGLIDYQMDLPLDAAGGVILFPHYEARVVPGWFDKPLPWRRAHREHMQDVLVLAPSEEWLASLPNGRIPDRKDFYRYAGDDRGRTRDWQRATDATRALADDFLETVTGDALAARLEPLPTRG